MLSGGSRKSGVDSLCTKSNVNEEYMEAFRTKSYIEIHSKVQGQLMNELPSSSSSFPFYIHLSDYLLEPCQETLANMIQTLNLHHLLIDYFQASLEACKSCEILLLRIHQTRANYQIIKRVIKLTKRLDDGEYYTTEQYETIFRELANKKTRRRAKFNRLCKRVAGFSLIISYSAVAVALVVLAIHSIVGIVIAPGLMGYFVGAVRNRYVFARRGLGTCFLERLGEQLDAAAKGIYILVNDFDTMSRLVSRLYDEVEHSKAIVDMCVRNGKSEMLMEVVKEFHVHDSFFLEQLEELEDHIYLCLLTINKSRMLVIQEIRDSE
ncbi:UPF0496 protein [Vitis vinifera]|uniref:UPF0496 protein n=1 Tax=Vitis vinifera TaxID=29760 RepID=A0A438CB82_VITVI|nr:UPF0496 protein [Vitis vinifera]